MDTQIESNREKILLVLKESIKFGKEVNFIYDNIYEKHKDVLFIKKLHTTMDEKMKLFENLDEKSYMFQTILDTAKIACNKLQLDEGYNYYSAELILKFNKIEECFKKKLKPIGVRIIEQKEKVKVENNPSSEGKDSKKYEVEIDENGDEIFYEKVEPLTKGAKYINGNVSGKSFHKKLKDQAEISLALKENNFQD